MCRDQLKEARAELASKLEELAAVTNAKESLAAQLAATEATLEEQARCSQTLEQDLEKCQDDLQCVTDERHALEVRLQHTLASRSLVHMLHASYGCVCWTVR